MEEIDAKTKIANFMVKQKQPYEFKKRYAEMTALKFAEECYKRNLNFHVSVSYLEDKSIQEVHKQLGIIRITSAKRKDGLVWNK